MNAEKLWDRLSVNFDKRVNKYEQSYARYVEKIRIYLNVKDIVLDFACGTGLIANKIAENVQKIYAIDISSKMLEAAKKKANELNIENINFCQSSIFDEKFKKESFDVILVFNVFHILENTQKHIQRINELLKPGGLIISATPCIGEKQMFLKILISLLKKIGIARYMNVFKTLELEDSIAKEKFRIVETEIMHQNPTNYFIVAKKI